MLPHFIFPPLEGPSKVNGPGRWRVRSYLCRMSGTVVNFPLECRTAGPGKGVLWVSVSQQCASPKLTCNSGQSRAGRRAREGSVLLSSPEAILSQPALRMAQHACEKVVQHLSMLGFNLPTLFVPWSIIWGREDKADVESVNQDSALDFCWLIPLIQRSEKQRKGPEQRPVVAC